MRRLVILGLALLLGAVLLWHFESRRIERTSTDDPSIEPIEPLGPDIGYGDGGSGVSGDGSTHQDSDTADTSSAGEGSGSTPAGEGSADSGTTDEAESLIKPDESVRVRGRIVVDNWHETDDDVRRSFIAQEAETRNSSGARSRLHLRDVVARAWVWSGSTPPEDVLRTKVVATTAEVDVTTTGQPDIELVDLFDVVVEQLRDTPLAPLTIEAPRLVALFQKEELRSVDDDQVRFLSRDIRGTGRGLLANTLDGQLAFESGADVIVELGKGRVALIRTPEGGPLRIFEENPEAPRKSGEPRLMRILASEGVHAEIRPDGSAAEETSAQDGESLGSTPIKLDAKTLDVRLEFTGDDERPRILSVRADDQVVIERGLDTYRGDTALFTFDESNEPTSIVLEDQPRLTYRAVDSDGQELELEISGAGPLTANFLGASDDKRDERRALQVEFRGPGRIESVLRSTSISFAESVTGIGREDRSRGDLRISGDVSVESAEGTLASEAIDAKLDPDGTIHVRSASATRLTRRDVADGSEFRLVAAGGLSARLAEDNWFVERADRTTVDSLGLEPFRVEADLIEDVDVNARTLRASENIVYRTVWGSAFAPVALVRDAETIELVGKVNDPVRFDFVPEDPELELEAVDVMNVRTGWVHAPKLTLTREAIYASESVNAEIETQDGVFGIDAASLVIEREVTGASFEADPNAPVPAGMVRALPAEELHLVARNVREARYGATYTSFVFSAVELDVIAPLAASDDDTGTGLNEMRETRFAAVGDVVALVETFSEDDALNADRTPEQSMRMRAAEMVFTLSSIVFVSGDEERPFTLRAKKIAQCVFEGEGRRYEVTADELDVDGQLGALTDEPKPPAEGATRTEDAPVDLSGTSLVARGDVSLVYQAAADQPLLRASQGHTLVLIDGERGSLKAEAGSRITSTGVMPGDGAPYRLIASEMDFQKDELQARGNIELEFINPVRPAAGGSTLLVKRLSETHMMNATEKEVILLARRPGEQVLVEFEDGSIGRFPSLSIDPAQFRDEGKSRRSVRPHEPVPVAAPQDDPPQAPFKSLDDTAPFEFERPDGFRFRGINAPDGVGFKQVTVSLPGDPIDMDLFGLVFDPTILLGAPPDFDYLISALRGSVRGEATAERPAWSFEFASIDMEPVDDEIMLTIVAPRIRVGDDEARADYLAIWLDRARWRAMMRNTLHGVPMPETFPGDTEGEAAARSKPNFLAELLFQVQSEKYGRNVRALFMEGGVEIARADRRAAKGSRLYLSLNDGVAWLENAELVYPLMTRGEEVPLRVRTERLATDDTGRLVANGATLTTCDHDVPHFVVRTREFSLEPRTDGRWRFGARGNRLRFQRGWQLPLPSIGNVVLDEEFGVEGIENEAGEVTPLRDIGIARTARFGTVLGAAFRFDIGNFGSWIGERIGMNTDKITGKWNTEAQWLGSRGPLVGLGLHLREREPGDDPDEDFRLDAHVSAIPDEGEDRGTVRVPEADRETWRLFGYVRSRYPIVRGEWFDFAIASQTDAGVQPEFREGDFLRFEQRDTFARWRKSFGADYLAAGVQKRIDDYRSQKEELPSFIAHRGERMIGRFTGAPVLWGGSFEAGYYTRREGEFLRDLFSDLPGGAGLGLGNVETGRADLIQRFSIPLQTNLAAIRVTPFAEARGTAWTNTIEDGADDPSRGSLRTGVELSTTLHKVTRDGYLHALAPRFSVSANPWYEETGGTPIPLDRTERAIDGTRLEAGLRAIWDRPRTFENLDFDLRAVMLRDRENGLADTTEFGALAEYITRYGDGEGQVGFRHDARFDSKRSETVYSRSSLAWRPTDEFLTEVRYGIAEAVDLSELYETASLVMRARLDPKWEIEGSYVRDLQNDEHLLTEIVLRRFSHDFVFDLTFQDRTGEGGTNISFSLLPLLGWTRSRLGMLDRR